MNRQAKQEYCGGIDVGGTKIAAALFTEDGRMSGRKRVPIDRGSPEKPVRQIIGFIHGLEDQARRKGGWLRAIGICIPGV
ncbi:MAG TPA: ROK family protein, partial [Candidatus Desulfaltia sp.]|nr:ROK family protein [Candidatus Desulfaltia sp.]